MIDLASSLHWWHWWIIAALLGIVEAFAPGAVAIWFAAAALVVGALLLVIPPMPWQLQLVLFVGLSVAALLVWRNYKGKHPETSEQPHLNQRAAQYIGQVYQLSEPIVQGNGKAFVGDGAWKVRGPDLPAGASVRVRAVEGALLIVEAA